MVQTLRAARQPLPPAIAVAAAAATLAVIAVTARAGAALAPLTGRPAVVDAAATLDLTVVASVVCWWILRRELRASTLALLPIFLASLAFAGWVLPGGDGAALRVLELAAVPLEIGAVVWLLRTVRGPGPLRDALAYEADVLRTALAGWRRPVLPADVLTYHRTSAWGAIVVALLMATATEVTVVHLVVARWSVKAAWLLTALGIYGALWILADWNACRGRPIAVKDGKLEVRFGLRWKVDIPLEAIAGVRAPGRALKRPSPGADLHLHLALPGVPIAILELDRPVTAVGIYGLRRRVRSVGLGVDEPRRLARLLGHVPPDATPERRSP